MFKVTFLFLLFLVIIIHVESSKSFRLGNPAMIKIDSNHHDSEYYDDYYEDEELHTTHPPTTRRRRTTNYEHVTKHPPTTRRRRTTTHPTTPHVTSKPGPGPSPSSKIDGGLVISILGTLRSPNGTAYAFNQTFILSPQ